tara:strand:+ start:1402 stop:1614 length:213 start_codon:yes stop_codon:yes gene_type:complete
MTTSGTGTRVLAELGNGDRTIQQLLNNISTPSGKKTTRHQLKHWVDYLETNGDIEKTSGTKWHNAVWSLT